MLGRAEAADPVLTEKYRVYFEGLSKDMRGASGLTDTNFSVILSDLDVGSVIYTKNIDKPFAVGDLSRLFLSFVLLKELGADYVFSTEVLVDHPPQEVRTAADVNVDFSRPVTGVGNLYIRGGGDPSLTLERIAGLSDELGRRGIVEVNDVILDSGYAAADLANPKELNFRRAFPLDRGCLRTFVFPGASGKPATVSTPSALSGVAVQSSVLTGPGTILDVTSQFKLASASEQKQGRIGGIFASGIVGIRSELKEICTPLSAADRMAILRVAVEQALKRGGVKFQSVATGVTSRDAVSLFVLQSARLSEIVSRTNVLPITTEIVESFVQQLPFAAGGQLDPAAGKEKALTDVRDELGDRGGLSFESIFGNDPTLIYSAADFQKFLQKMLSSYGFSAELRGSMPRVGEGELALGKLLNPLYIRNIRGRDLEEKKTLIKSIRAFSSFGDNSTALLGIAAIPGGRKMAFTIIGDGGNNKLVRETTVLDLLKIALQLPVSVIDSAPVVVKEEPKPGK